MVGQIAVETCTPTPIARSLAVKVYKRIHQRQKRLSRYSDLGDWLLMVTKSDGWTEMCWRMSPRHVMHSDSFCLVASPCGVFEFTVGSSASEIFTHQEVRQTLQWLNVFTEGAVAQAILRFATERPLCNILAYRLGQALNVPVAFNSLAA